VTRRGRLTRGFGALSTLGLVASLSVVAVPVAAPAGADAGQAYAAHAVRAASIGRLAYQTNRGAIDTVEVHADGLTSDRVKVGPVQASTTAHPVSIVDFVASGNGRFLAWQETKTTTASHFSTTLVLLNEVSGVVHTVRSGKFPVGFAGDSLLTFNNRHVFRVVLAPSPHFVRVAGGFPVTTYRHGVVDVSTNDADTAEKLRLTSMSGHHTMLHRYTDIGPPDFREISQAWVSQDGDRLVAERGDHQDFGGLGPSSVADEFTLHGSHARTKLGHVGALHGEWRLGDVGFRGHSDAVWAAWHALGRHGVKTVIAHVSQGHWVTFMSGAIDVAASSSGNLVVQPGRYRLQKPADNFYARHATGPATLVRHGASIPLHGVKGTQFFWMRDRAVVLRHGHS
jgi:hypothetical protein